MAGSRSRSGWTCRTGDDGARARAVLAAVAGVASVDDGAHAGDPWIVTMAPGADPIVVRSAVLAEVASEGLPLASIRAVVPSLEDIYRRAVARPATSPGSSASSAPAAPGRPERDRAAASAGDVPAARHETSRASVDRVEPVTLPAPDASKEDQA